MVHKKLLKQIGIDLEYLKHAGPEGKKRYDEAEVHLSQLAGYTSVSRTTVDDAKKYGRLSK